MYIMCVSVIGSGPIEQFQTMYRLQILRATFFVSENLMQISLDQLDFFCFIRAYLAGLSFCEIIGLIGG